MSTVSQADAHAVANDYVSSVFAILRGSPTADQIQNQTVKLRQRVEVEAKDTPTGHFSMFMEIVVAHLAEFSVAPDRCSQLSCIFTVQELIPVCYQSTGNKHLLFFHAFMSNVLQNPVSTVDVLQSAAEVAGPPSMRVGKSTANSRFS